MTATEKAQLYVSIKDSRTTTPHYQLCGIKAVTLAPGECAEVTFTADRYWMLAVGENGEFLEPDGEICFFIGGHQPDAASDRLTGTTTERIKLQ